MRLALLDFDGTLVSYPYQYVVEEMYRLSLDVFGVQQEREDIVERYSSFNLFGFLSIEEQRAKEQLFWEAFDWNRFPPPHLVPGSVDALRLLCDLNFVPVIVTSRIDSPERFRERLESLGIAHYIDAVITKHKDETHWKEKGGIFRAVLHKYQADPRQSVAIGDTPSDINSAREADIHRVIAVRTGGISDEALQRSEPCFILDSIGNLSRRYIQTCGETCAD